ncbi:unnamed protein product [Paramecium sonneborni]|uniref:Transmembrane protein n=1 Tax=Paramecium sonneborni TaxID=65129 RepID=A0A8S1PDM7_9CILI|nr:unnamed protein product [Paramecium sonneborni]
MMSKIQVDFAKTVEDPNLPRPWSRNTHGLSAFQKNYKIEEPFVIKKINDKQLQEQLYKSIEPQKEQKSKKIQEFLQQIKTNQKPIRKSLGMIIKIIKLIKYLKNRQRKTKNIFLQFHLNFQTHFPLISPQKFYIFSQFHYINNKFISILLIYIWLVLVQIFDIQAIFFLI